MNKVFDSLTPALLDSSNSQNNALKTDKRKKHKKHSKKDKKENTTLLDSLGSNNSKNKGVKNTLKIVNNQKELTNAVEVVTIAAVKSLAIIGGKLADYFTEQDKENAVLVLKDTEKSQPVAWCSNSTEVSENVEDVKCSKSRKIIQTAGTVTQKENKICRSLKTEVVTENGEIKTETQHLCQAEDGEWYDE